MAMGVGRLYLKARQFFENGVRAAIYREILRPRILKTSPVRNLDRDNVEIHVLTHSGDWINLIWTLKSFYRVSDRRYALCIHEDGSLDEDAKRTLQSHFPEARFIDRGRADRKVAKLLSGKPRSKAFRASNPLALKVFDFQAFLRAERMFLLDSDVLFFKTPHELIRRLEDTNYQSNTLNRDWRYGYSVDIENVRKHIAFNLPSKINSGLGLILKQSINFDMIEEFLSLPKITSHSHRVEQTLIALSSAKFGFEFLPAEYDVHRGPFDPSDPCRHFTGPIRHRMWTEGMRWLACDGILKE